MSETGDTSEPVRFAVEHGVAHVVIDAPPMNVMTGVVVRGLTAAVEAIDADPDTRVVVLESADREFFIAHYDVAAILHMPAEGDADEVEPPTEPTVFHELCERLRTMPTVSIAKIAGRVGGGGAELAASCDMRFGAYDTMVLNQMEVPLGIVPGGSGTQRIPRLVGRGRAMEIILGGIDVDAATAEQWGWLNRALPADELDWYVDWLAQRIAGFPPEAVAEAKAAILAAEPDPTPGLVEEAYRFQRALRGPLARPSMEAFLRLGGQTRQAEGAMEELTGRLAIDRED